MKTDSSRLQVKKTYKMLINGKFARSESGEVAPSTTNGMSGLVPVASRKDTRDAVRAALSAQPGWDSKTPYNKGQILYRMAEMLEARPVFDSGVSEAVDALVYWAGWCDKLASVATSSNPVSTGHHLNITSLHPCGTTAFFVPLENPLVSLCHAVGAMLAGGNSLVAVSLIQSSLPVLEFGEIVATSDVPPGVVNLLSTSKSEVVKTLCEHGDVQAVDLTHLVGWGLDPVEFEVQCALTLKRVATKSDTQSLLHRALWACETKTLWHPKGQ